MKLRHSCKLLLISRERVNMILALVLPTKSWLGAIRFERFPKFFLALGSASPSWTILSHFSVR
ncbi:hypothetical protein, partial [Klebsiella pneumoniae]|uniref:hypothetical protein n=1 Tax=Klebsiella pneumoniae TaxID=573 RepID=UPI003FD3E603